VTRKSAERNKTNQDRGGLMAKGKLVDGCGELMKMLRRLIRRLGIVVQLALKFSFWL